MRLRTQPMLFNRLFVDAVTIRPLLHTLLENRRARSAHPGGPVDAPVELDAHAPVVQPLTKAA